MIPIKKRVAKEFYIPKHKSGFLFMKSAAWWTSHAFFLNSNVQSFPIKTGVSTSWLVIDGAKNVVIFCSQCVRHQRGPIWISFQINKSDYTTDRGPVFFILDGEIEREAHFRNITSISALRFSLFLRE